MMDERDFRARFRRAYGDESASLGVGARLRDHLMTVPRARQHRSSLAAIAAVAAVVLAAGSATAAIVSRSHHAPGVTGPAQPVGPNRAILAPVPTAAPTTLSTPPLPTPAVTVPVPHPSAAPTRTPTPTCPAAAVAVSTTASVSGSSVTFHDPVTNHAAIECTAPAPVGEQILDQHGTVMLDGTIADSTGTTMGPGKTVDALTWTWDGSCPSGCTGSGAATYTIKVSWSDGRSTSATFTLQRP